MSKVHSKGESFLAIGTSRSFVQRGGAINDDGTQTEERAMIRARSSKTMAPVLAIFALYLLAPTAPADAIPGWGLTLHYYSDASYTNHVGMQMLLRCNGSSGPVIGMWAPYAVEVEYDCHEQTYHPGRCLQYPPMSCHSADAHYPYQHWCQQTGPATPVNCPEPFPWLE
jgi:hypothetical protein